MDFFLDSGIFLGLCDPRDEHNETCKNFLKEYPLYTNNYYTTKMVRTELRWKRLRRIKMGYDNTVVRRIEQCIQRWLERMKKIVEYEKDYVSFDYLASDIRRIINYKQNDAIIVTNAIFWSCKCNTLDNPTLITIDYYDIIIKADKIIEQAELRFDRGIPLTIKAAWDI